MKTDPLVVVAVISLAGFGVACGGNEPEAIEESDSIQEYGEDLDPQEDTDAVEEFGEDMDPTETSD
jgi:hypothetical protein